MVSMKWILEIASLPKDIAFIGWDPHLHYLLGTNDFSVV